MDLLDLRTLLQANGEAEIHFSLPGEAESLVGLAISTVTRVDRFTLDRNRMASSETCVLLQAERVAGAGSRCRASDLDAFLAMVEPIFEAADLKVGIELKGESSVQYVIGRTETSVATTRFHLEQRG